MHFFEVWSCFLFYVLRFFLTMGIVRAQLEVPSEALLHLSVVSRSSLGGIRQDIRKKEHIFGYALFGVMGRARGAIGYRQGLLIAIVSIEQS